MRGCIYGMNLLQIGLLFTLETEGQNLQNKIKSKIGGEVRLDLSLKDALFIYLSEYVTFRMSFGWERCPNYKKSRKNTNLSGNYEYFGR